MILYVEIAAEIPTNSRKLFENKRTIVFATRLTLASYELACACPGAVFMIPIIHGKGTHGRNGTTPEEIVLQVEVVSPVSVVTDGKISKHGVFTTLRLNEKKVAFEEMIKALHHSINFYVTTSDLGPIIDEAAVAANEQKRLAFT